MTDYLRGCVIIRIIDADSLTELFREVIGHISKEPTITKDMEHMARASAMTIEMIADAPTIDVSEISDGYHTFADLYEQRLILSAALAKDNPYAWKSKLHSDGTEPFGGGWFVMGWKTENGQYTYHYELKDWDLFYCKEIQKAPEWDGHTSNDVRRLLTLPTIDAVPVIRCKDCRFCRKYKENICTCLKFDSGRNMYDYCSYAQIKEADFGETMRERLIELLDQNCGYVSVQPAERLADYLLSHGVVVRDKGEWEHIHGYATPGGDPVLGCPYCHSRESHHVNGIEIHHQWNFCPNCGADLRGEQHEL